MSLFGPARFQGTLCGHGSRIPIGFDVTVDCLGVLQLSLDRIPFSREAYALYVNGRPGTPADLITLEGRSEAGGVFRSASFHIGQFSHGSQPGQELSYQGDCYDAELELPLRQQCEPRRDARVWYVRQLRTFRHIAHETPLGRVITGGPLQNREAQKPNGFIAVYRPEHDSSEDWWSEGERLLTHVAHVLSFACGIYLRPVIEERHHSDGITVRMVRRGKAAAPFLAPFHELNMQPIFACACDSYFTRYQAIHNLDAAIRWMTASVVYGESRLINAMTALENILDRCGLQDAELFMSDKAFRKVAKRLRELLREIGVPDGMTCKVSELNRRSLNEKVTALLRERGISIHDMPKDWLATVIHHRNVIVHTGVSSESGEHESYTFVHTIWVREVLTRIILERLDFQGAFRSWLHHNEELYFPDCIPMKEWGARRDAQPLQGES